MVDDAHVDPAIANASTIVRADGAAGLSARTRILIGDQGVERLRAARVFVAGLGGVGAFAAEALARAGIGELILADGDCVAASNLNRQLCALRSTLGQPKVAVMRQRLLDINPACHVTAIPTFLTADELPMLVGEGGFDQIIDAIDSLSSKLALLGAALDAAIPIVSSMGAGGRLDPTRLRVGDLMDSGGCRLARKVRRNLRRRGYERGITAVWSDEPSRPPLLPESCDPGRARAVNGTISYLPGLFGLSLAGIVIQRLVHSERAI